MKFILTLLIIIVSSTTSLAGGFYYPVEVTQFEIDQADNMSFTLTIKPIGTKMQLELGPCEIIKIKGYYDEDKWKKYKHPMSKGTHLHSLELLENAHESKETILFGAMGNGLIQIEDCLYESKGLFSEDHDNKIVVFSVNDSI